MADLTSVHSRGLKVMSTFACGGGSSLGYKRAGFEVIAANDIDPDMAWHYKRNIAPRWFFECPIRELLTKELPSELFALDVLDGSPPCSTFSTSGSREKAWGKMKHFAEGQAKQVLSDLFFDFLDVVGYLNPRVVIAENVRGLILGNARGYVKLIMARLRELGYLPQLFLINAADCGVPQRRERVFFVAQRKDLNRKPLVLSPKHRWISCGEATRDLILSDEEKKATEPFPMDCKYWPLTKQGDSYESAALRIEGKSKFWSHVKIHRDRPSNTLTTKWWMLTHWDEMRALSLKEYTRLAGFPDDYVSKDMEHGYYLMGMSVPPRMTEAVATAVAEQWLS